MTPSLLAAGKIAATLLMSAASAVIVPGADLPQLQRERVTRQPWCDMAAHVARLQPLPMQDDPVFRQPTAMEKSRLGRVRKTLLTGTKAPSDARNVALFAALLTEPTGVALARIAMQDASVRVRLPALMASRKVAAQHPRLASFAGPDVRHADPTIALAAARMLLAARCDTTGTYALDALEHADAQVRASIALATLRNAREMRDMGLVGTVIEHAATVERDPHTRAAIIRELGHIGWQPAAGTLAQLTTDGDELVRAEATVALARVTSKLAAASIAALVKSKVPWSRLSAARAAAASGVHDPAKARALLQPLLGDRRRARDPLQTTTAYRIDEAARTALAHIAER